MTAGLAASIHARLLNRAKVPGEDFNLVLTRYVIERFLYRMSQGPARDSLWLKGALRFDLWFDVPHRHNARKCAEALAPHRIPSSLILGAYVVSQAASVKLATLKFALPVAVDSVLFFQ